MSETLPVIAVPPSESSKQDREWVARALEGDEWAYAQLVGKYSKALHHHISRTVHATREVEDLVQEAFIKAFNALGTYSSSYAFSTWLYKIATNHAIDFLRKKRLKTLSIDKPVQGKDGELQMELPDVTYRPDRHIVESQRSDVLKAAIDKLPPKYHRVIVLRHQQEMTYEEIADTLQLPLGTVKAHIFRARRLLYARLRDKRDSL